MTIYQENSSVNTAQSSTSGIVTDKSSIETTVTVDDGQVLVLGGLLKDEYTNGVNKVPGLGDVPVVGNLFRNDNRSRTKTNLMVFLRPVIMKTADAVDSVSINRYDSIRGLQQASQPTQSVLVPVNASPVLPPANSPGGLLPMGYPDYAAPSMSPQEAGADHLDSFARSDAAAFHAAVVADPSCRTRRDELTERPPWAHAIPFPTLMPRSNTLLLEDDGERLTLWADEKVPLSALSEVLRLYEVDAFERESSSTLAGRIASAYAGSESSAATVIGEVESRVDLSRMMQDLPAVEDLLEAANDAPIIRMLNALLTQAAKDGASDIHIEPYERSSAVRFRVDGTLREVVQPNKALHAALISRLKIMAELDIAEKRLPQDGRISLRIGGRAIDVRVSTLPSAHGERAVLRLLDKSESKFTLEGLGMSGDVLGRFDRMIQQPHGIVLVTGPTGSGKTTTLYASLSRLETSVTNVLTVEDPVEYELPGIGQTQVNARIDLTFAKALRAILRQDPDVIMIGEIRDFETAQIAIQASLTGHLVLATLHTNDAPSAVTRLTDMGVEPFLLSSSLLGVLAQRLVRKLCPICKKQDARGRYTPVGCPECSMSGYKGRTGVYEMLVADDNVRALIHSRAAESQLFVAAEQAGMRSMREDGDRLVSEGITSAQEVMRVTRE